ncbi:DoxX family protein [Neolewinella antarctica]|uniref:Membrane protein n=1 Tax=Neolewinella antarctica TaxID=442734 RepID=A0ABX0XCZ9_9BACT|nr:hypothetical protein [Neolewinella antarctica]NJC27174.1 putative membrane protein [Neolewinella antarctica]
MKLPKELNWAKNVKTSKTQTVLKVLLGGALLFAGISHLTFNRKEFPAQVPDWVPMPVDQVVILSGIAEIGLGSALILSDKWRAFVGLGAGTFFVLIFPGNISQYVNERDGFGLDTDRKRRNRLFFQPVLVLWALWSTGAIKAFLNRKG